MVLLPNSGSCWLWTFRNPYFHNIDLTNATSFILSFYFPYVNKPKDYFILVFRLFQPSHINRINKTLITKVRKLEKKIIKISWFSIFRLPRHS